MSATSSSASLQVDVHIVEDHDEALPHIYRAIAKRLLPFRGSALIHFDSHPDLLSPDIKANDVTDTDQLYSRTSIADWILPAVYMGHIACIIWVKPPWAEQIPEGKHLLLVGKDKMSEEIRVATPLPYFLGEMLWVPKQELVNIVEVPLEVVTLHPLPAYFSFTPTSGSYDDQIQVSCSRLHGKHDDPLPENQRPVSSLHPTSSGSHDQSEVSASRLHSDPYHPVTDKRRCLCHDKSSCQGSIQNQSQSPPTKKARKTPCCLTDASMVSSITMATKFAAWILDIDLDFFSTGNPYRDIYSTDQYSLLQKLYKLEEPVDYSEEALRQCTSVRHNQLDKLKQLWSSDTLPDSSGAANCDNNGTCTEESGRTTGASRCRKSEIQLAAKERNLVAEIKGYLWKYYEDSFVDPDYLHTSGLVYDLPIHVSDAEEIAYLVKGLQNILYMAHKKPCLVTISRSAEDEYTPSHQVDDIQKQVLQALQSSLENMAGDTGDKAQMVVHQHYLEKSLHGPPDEEDPRSPPDGESLCKPSEEESSCSIPEEG